jgi:hypothetical protein
VKSCATLKFTSPDCFPTKLFYAGVALCGAGLVKVRRVGENRVVLTTS